MKKRIVATIVIFMLSLTTFAGGVLANEAYNQWNGTEAYNSLMITLESIGVKSKDTKQKLETANQTNSQLTSSVESLTKQLNEENKNKNT